MMISMTGTHLCGLLPVAILVALLGQDVRAQRGGGGFNSWVTTTRLPCTQWTAWSTTGWQCNTEFGRYGSYFEEYGELRTRTGGCSSLEEVRGYDSRQTLDNGVCNTACSSWSNSGNFYGSAVCSEQTVGVYKLLEEEMFNSTRTGVPCYTNWAQYKTGNVRWGGDCWSEWSSCSQTCGTGTRTRYLGTSGNSPTSQSCKIIDCIVFPTGCDAEVDITFIVDASGSIKAANFPLIQQFVVTLAEALRQGIDSGRTRVSTIRYSSPDRISQIFNFNDYSKTNDIIQAIHKMAYTQGTTYTALALNFMLENSFLPANGYRTNVPDMAFVVTDGVSYDAVDGPAQRVKAHGVITYAIGVTSGVNVTQLNAFATSPQHVFLASTFAQLSGITAGVMTAVCTEAQSLTTAATSPTTSSTTTSPTSPTSPITSFTSPATSPRSPTTSPTTSPTKSTTASPITSPTTSPITSPTTSTTTSTTTVASDPGSPSSLSTPAKAGIVGGALAVAGAIAALGACCAKAMLAKRRRKKEEEAKEDPDISKEVKKKRKMMKKKHNFERLNSSSHSSSLSGSNRVSPFSTPRDSLTPVSVSGLKFESSLGYSSKINHTPVW